MSFKSCLWTILVILLAQSAHAQAKAAQVIQLFEGWQARLKLTEPQKTQTKALLEQLSQGLEPLADKVDAGEIDKKAALQQIVAARNSFEKSFEGILTDPQKKEWDKIQEEIHGFVLTKIGTKRATKLQQQYGLNESQTQACVAPLAKQTGEFMEFLEAAQASKDEPSAGGRRAKKAKLKQARELKGIAGDADDELKKIFTAEQWQKYEADKAKKKEQLKQKAQSRG